MLCVRTKKVCKVYRTSLQSIATGFLMPDQRHFLSLYSYSFLKMCKISIFRTIYCSLTRKCTAASVSNIKKTLHTNICITHLKIWRLLVYIIYTIIPGLNSGGRDLTWPVILQSCAGRMPLNGLLWNNPFQKMRHHHGNPTRRKYPQ